MEKIESPKLEENIPLPPAGGGWKDKLFGVIKFILGLCLLPFVYSTTMAFINEMNGVPAWGQNYFYAGIISLLVIHLFIWEPTIIYAKGHKIMEVIFSFVKPIVKVAPYLVPIYALLVLIIYTIWSTAGISEEVTGYFVFFFGFSIGLHLIFSAKTLRSKKEDFLKANYIFGFSFVYCINLLILSSCFNVVFSKFSFVNFSNNSYQTAKVIFEAVFKQLFLR